MDLTICVGETCHLNGAEVVVKAIMNLLDEEGLSDQVCLRGSFCMGACSEKREVTVRCGDQLLYADYRQADAFAREQLLPLLRSDDRA